MEADALFARLRAVMLELFEELEPAAIRPEARLVEDLDLDSIDAVDLTVKLEGLTGQRVEERELRELRTVGDVLVLLDRHLARKR